MWSLGMTYFTKAPDRRTLIKKICTHPCIVSVFIGFVLILWEIQCPPFRRNRSDDSGIPGRYGALVSLSAVNKANPDLN